MDDGDPGLDLGPQYDRDDAFAQRMRAHQSWYRAAVLDVVPGVGPRKGSSARYGNYLPVDAAERGDNFLTDHIWEMVQERIARGGGVVRYRCLHNLLSSQPMCFNLFGQLVERSDLASRLFSALLPDVVGEVEDVRIEWAPQPNERFLNDATSFDAFVEVRRAGDGVPGFLAIETKLTEPFSQEVYGLDHRPAYRRMVEGPGSTWTREGRERVAARRWNQLWRNQMLAMSLAEDAASPYAFGVPIVVHHPLDVGAVDAEAGYRELLQDPASIHALDLREISDQWRPLTETDEDRRWIDSFDARYLQLQLSERVVAASQARDDREVRG